MRLTFDTVDEMIEWIRNNPGLGFKKNPYKVEVDGEIKYILASNSDGAVAGVVRYGHEVKVESVGMDSLMN